MKTALITGITGQDGAYLSNLLIDKGYRVIGITRDNSPLKLSKLAHLKVIKKIVFKKCDLLNFNNISNLIKIHKPDEIYNLAAQSSVGQSFQSPHETISFNINSVLNILESIKNTKHPTRLYQASSSEMYGSTNDLPLTEESKFNPISPYGVSKANAHALIAYYRKTENLFASTGIMFNHESYLRQNSFFIKKVIRNSLMIYHGHLDKLIVGNIDIKRDFGFSPSYTEAMWKILQHERADDFIICSGESISLREIIHYIFNKLDIPINKIIIDKNLYRPNEINDIYGDPSKALKELKWKYNLKFFKVIDIILKEEMLFYNK